MDFLRFFLIFFYLYGSGSGSTFEADDWLEVEFPFDFSPIPTEKEMMMTRAHTIPPPIAPELEKWTSVAVKEHHDQLFRHVFQLLAKEGLYSNDGSGGFSEKGPFAFRSRSEMFKLFNFTLGNRGADNLEISKLIETILDYSPTTSHPLNLHKRAGILDPYAVAADWMVSTLSSPLVTYLVTPVFTMAEFELISTFREFVGYSETTADGSPAYGVGIGTPYPNGFAIQVSLQEKYPDLKMKGLVEIGGPRPVIFASEVADYSIEKQASSQGVGLNGVIRVGTNENKQMDPQLLEQSIEEAIANNFEPTLIIATAGSPVYGSIDDLETIAEIARKYNIWFHVDASCAGSYLFSEKLKSKLNGINLADSVGWDPNCVFGVPAETSIFVTSETRNQVLPIKFGMNSAYVYNTSTLTKAKWNLGEWTLQTCRRPYTFIVWYMMKAHGISGLGKIVDHVYRNSRLAIGEIKYRPNLLKLVIEEQQLPYVSFYYLLQRKDLKGREYVLETNRIMAMIKTKLLLGNIMHLSITPGINGQPNFFTLKLTNPALNLDIIRRIFIQLEFCGKEVELGRQECTKVPTFGNNSFPAYSSSRPGDFLSHVSELILKEAMYFQNKRADPPMIFATPEDLVTYVNFGLGHQSIGDNQELFNILENTIKYSPHQAVVSSNQVNYEDNPIFTMVEEELSNTIINVIGWPQGEVIYPPGGSLGNMFAIEIARMHKYPHIKTDGYSAHGKILRGYVSTEAHYSLKKGGLYLGLGKDNIVGIPTDFYGRMIIETLREQIVSDLENGMEPFFIGATSGTTVLGAIDPLQEVAALCKEFDLWFHVDGAFGGSMIFSKNHRRRLAGIEHADSFSFNPAKMFATTLIMNCFATKHVGLLRATHEYTGPFETDTNYDLNLFKKHDNHHDSGMYLQRSRRSRALKFWLMIKAKGLNGLSQHMDYVFELVAHCVAEMNKRGDTYVPIFNDFDATNVLFLYIPMRFRDMDRYSKEFYDGISTAAFELQALLVKEGIAIVVAQRHQTKFPMHLKFVLMSSGVSFADIDHLLDEIDKLGRNL